MSDINRAVKVPLCELLRSIPRGERILTPGDIPAEMMSPRSLPVGVLAHEAADHVEILRAYLAAITEENDRLLRDNAASNARVAELLSLINTPQTNEWFEAVGFEAAHQIERRGGAHDAGKTPMDWFWLIGFLAQKAAMAEIQGDIDKAKHHTISTGAAMLNWFRALTGESNSIRPWIEPPTEDAGNDAF